MADDEWFFSEEDVDHCCNSESLLSSILDLSSDSLLVERERVQAKIEELDREQPEVNLPIVEEKLRVMKQVVQAIRPKAELLQARLDRQQRLMSGSKMEPLATTAGSAPSARAPLTSNIGASAKEALGVIPPAPAQAALSSAEQTVLSYNDMTKTCKELTRLVTRYKQMASQLEFARERLKLLNRHILRPILEVPNLPVEHEELSVANQGLARIAGQLEVFKDRQAECVKVLTLIKKLDDNRIAAKQAMLEKAWEAYMVEVQDCLEKLLLFDPNMSELIRKLELTEVVNSKLHEAKVRLEDSVRLLQPRSHAGSEAKRTAGIKALRSLEEALVNLENYVYIKLQEEVQPEVSRLVMEQEGRQHLVDEVRSQLVDEMVVLSRSSLSGDSFVADLPSHNSSGSGPLPSLFIGSSLARLSLNGKPAAIQGAVRRISASGRSERTSLNGNKGQWPINLSSAMSAPLSMMDGPKSMSGPPSMPIGRAKRSSINDNKGQWPISLSAAMSAPTDMAGPKSM